MTAEVIYKGKMRNGLFDSKKILITAEKICDGGDIADQTYSIKGYINGKLRCEFHVRELTRRAEIIDMLERLPRDKIIIRFDTCEDK